MKSFKVLVVSCFKKNFFFIKKSKIKHGFFTSLNGLSKKEFKSLNCSTYNDDDKKIVYKNRLIAMKNLKVDKKKLNFNKANSLFKSY